MAMAENPWIPHAGNIPEGSFGTAMPNDAEPFVSSHPWEPLADWRPAPSAGSLQGPSSSGWWSIGDNDPWADDPWAGLIGEPALGPGSIASLAQNRIPLFPAGQRESQLPNLRLPNSASASASDMLRQEGSDKEGDPPVPRSTPLQGGKDARRGYSAASLADHVRSCISEMDEMESPGLGSAAAAREAVNGRRVGQQVELPQGVPQGEMPAQRLAMGGSVGTGVGARDEWSIADLKGMLGLDGAEDEAGAEVPSAEASRGLLASATTLSPLLPQTETQPPTVTQPQPQPQVHGQMSAQMPGLHTATSSGQQQRQQPLTGGSAVHGGIHRKGLAGGKRSNLELSAGEGEAAAPREASPPLADWSPPEPPMLLIKGFGSHGSLSSPYCDSSPDTPSTPPSFSKSGSSTASGSGSATVTEIPSGSRAASSQGVDSAGGDAEGCPCGGCSAQTKHPLRGVQRKPSRTFSGSSIHAPGDGASDGPGGAAHVPALSAQAVDAHSRPADLSGRLAAIIDSLSPGMCAGSDGDAIAEQGTLPAHLQPQEGEPSILHQIQTIQTQAVEISLVHQLRAQAGEISVVHQRQPQAEEPPLVCQELVLLPRQQRQLLLGDPGLGAAAGLKRDAYKNDGHAKAVKGDAGALKRDARRKKAKTTPATGLASLKSQRHSGVDVAQEQSLAVARYFHTFNEDVAWGVTPGTLQPSSTPMPMPKPMPMPMPMPKPEPHLPVHAAFTLGSWPVGLSSSAACVSVEVPSSLTRQGGDAFLGWAHAAPGTPAMGSPLDLPGSFMGPGWLMGFEGEGAALELSADSRSRNSIREQLLALAESYATDDLGNVRSLLKKVGKKADKAGSSDQRLAAYFLDALVARADGSASQKYLEPITCPAAEINSAMGALCKSVPFLQASQVVLHELILQTTAGCDSIHILALGIWQGDNWQELFRRLAQRPGGPPRRLRISGLDAPHTPGKLAVKLSSANVVLQVKAAAASAGLEADVQFLPVPMEKFRASDIPRQPDEALFVFSTMRLQHLPDSSVVRSNPRDSVLQAVFDLKPKAFLVTDVDANFNSPFFLARFKEALHYFGSTFDCVDAASDPQCPRRRRFEETYFGRDILNVVACEGLHRMSRSERLEQWACRLGRTGFKSHPLPDSLFDKLSGLFASRAREARKNGYSTAEDKCFRAIRAGDALEIGWCMNRMLFASLWTP